MHPPPSAARANFTLVIERTPESDCCYSVYSVESTASWMYRYIDFVLEVRKSTDFPLHKIKFVIYNNDITYRK